MTLSMFVIILLLISGTGIILIFIRTNIVPIVRELIRVYYLEKEEHYRRCAETDDEILKEMFKREKVH